MDRPNSAAVRDISRISVRFTGCYPVGLKSHRSALLPSFHPMHLCPAFHRWHPCFRNKQSVSFSFLRYAYQHDIGASPWPIQNKKKPPLSRNTDRANQSRNSVRSATSASEHFTACYETAPKQECTFPLKEYDTLLRKGTKLENILTTLKTVQCTVHASLEKQLYEDYTKLHEPEKKQNLLR